MTFDLRKLDDQNWQIFDESDELMFSGSLESCRDWLDFQEGRQQRTFLQMVSGWFSRSPKSAPPLVSSAQSTSESGVLN